MPQPLMFNKSLRVTYSNDNYNRDAAKTTVFVSRIRAIFSNSNINGFFWLLEKNNFVRTTYCTETLSYEKDT